MMKIGIQQWLQKEKLQLNVDHLQKKQLQRERQLQREQQQKKQLQRERQLQREKPLQREQQQKKQLQSEDDNPLKITSRHLETICFPFSNFQFKIYVIFYEGVL
jgi:hypothetical protein